MMRRLHAHFSWSGYRATSPDNYLTYDTFYPESFCCITCHFINTKGAVLIPHLSFLSQKIALPLTCELTPPITQSVNQHTQNYKTYIHTRAISRCGREEKEPSPLLPTRLCQLLQIQHLTQRHTPQRQNVLVEMVIYISSLALPSRKGCQEEKRIQTYLHA